MMSAAGEVGRDNYPSPEGNSAIVEAQLQVPSKDWLEVRPKLHSSVEIFFCIYTGVRISSQKSNFRSDPPNYWFSTEHRCVYEKKLEPSLTKYIFAAGHVPALQHSVPSQYADGLFIQHPDSTGKIYNVHCFMTIVILLPVVI